MRGRLLRAAALLVVIVAVGVVASAEHRLYDLTAERTLTLSEQTRTVLEEIDRDVDITAFLRRGEPGRVEAASLLDRYRKLNRHVDWELVDPDQSPGEAQRLGVDPVLGGVALRAGEEVEQAPAATEQDLTAALARLVRGRDATICLTAGHGEPELAEAAALLEADGYAVAALDLLADPEVPGRCSAVVLAGPTAPLGGSTLESLATWTADYGKLLVLADPIADLDLSVLLEPVGLQLQRGIVVEGDPDSVAGGDVTAPIVRSYSAAHPIGRKLAPTYFPGVQAIEVDEDAEAREPGLTVTRLADTSPLAYLETEPAGAAFDPDTDLGGPITVVAAADRSINDGDTIRRTRVVAVGDVDFAGDTFVGEAANAALFLRSVGWLTLGEDLDAISPNLPADRPLRLSDARVTYARLVTAALVPLLFVLAGAMVWAARRTR